MSEVDRIHFEKMLKRIGDLANPSTAALKARTVPPVGSFPNLIAKLCLFSSAVKPLERCKILSFVPSEDVRRVASYTLSGPCFPDAAGRSAMTRDFNKLVERYVSVLALCALRTHRSTI